MMMFMGKMMTMFKLIKQDFGNDCKNKIGNFIRWLVKIHQCIIISKLMKISNILSSIANEEWNSHTKWLHPLPYLKVWFSVGLNKKPHDIALYV